MKQLVNVFVKNTLLVNNVINANLDIGIFPTVSLANAMGMP